MQSIDNSHDLEAPLLENDKKVNKPKSSKLRLIITIIVVLTFYAGVAAMFGTHLDQIVLFLNEASDFLTSHLFTLTPWIVILALTVCMIFFVP